ncbi:hypothetical protein [Bifidobacterium catulorum]|uniref:hypothetical protein n=1 Tax=Bifidobacterium catulorum TaxID=1630173 RepID=UPI001F4D9834|nr:hypothetical protein [Bifidobacterium catulorum]
MTRLETMAGNASRRTNGLTGLPVICRYFSSAVARRNPRASFTTDSVRRKRKTPRRGIHERGA